MQVPAGPKKSNLRRYEVETFKDNLAGSQVTSKTGIQSRCTRQLPWLLNSNRLLLNLKMGECLQSYWITILFKTLKTKYQNCTILFRWKYWGIGLGANHLDISIHSPALSRGSWAFSGKRKWVRRQTTCKRKTRATIFFRQFCISRFEVQLLSIQWPSCGLLSSSLQSFNS